MLPKASKTLAAYVWARRELEVEYLRAFGVAWDASPWGDGSWTDVAAEANAVDRDYVDAARVLDEVVVSLKHAKELLLNRGLGPVLNAAEIRSADFVGLTMPEALLAMMFSESHAPADDSLTTVLSIDAVLRDPWQTLPDIIERNAGASELGPAWANRTLRAVRLVAPNEERVIYRPGLGGPPPRTTDQLDEWRRAYFVEVLGVRSHRSRDGEMHPVSARQIAVVNLLAGALTAYSPTDLKSLTELIERERRAVIAVRKRRGFHAWCRQPSKPNTPGGNSPVQMGRQKVAVRVRTSKAKRRRVNTEAFVRLCAEYKRSFRCDWDATPWGGVAWPVVLAEAMECDRRYIAAASAIARIDDALVSSRDYLATRGLSLPEPATTFSLDTVIGRTLPEAYLYWLWAGTPRTLPKLLADVREAKEILETRWGFGFEDKNQIASFDIGGDTTEVVGERLLSLWTKWWRESTNRNIRYAVVEAFEGHVRTRAWAPGLGGPPPRTLENATEWRRAYLADLLGAFAFPETMLQDEQDVRRIDDRAIAVVSLLLGDGPIEWRNVAAVISAERKAIALARKRRAAAWRVHARSYARATEARRI